MSCTLTPGLHNDGCNCPPDAAPPILPPCPAEECRGGRVILRHVPHTEYDQSGREITVDLHAAIGSCAHSLRHRITRTTPDGTTTVVSEAATAYGR